MAEAKQQPSKKPTKNFPTTRVAFEKQCDLLRGWVAASGSAGRPTTNRAVAAIVKMAQPTVSLANAFFIENGFLQKSEGGLVPAPEVKSYARFSEFSPESAGHKLAPLLEKSWFYQALHPHLRFGQMNKRDALATLADESHAGSAYLGRLRVILDYLELAGLIHSEGDLITTVSSETREFPPQEPPVAQKAQSVRGAHIPSTAVVPQSTEGAVNFHVDVRVDMSELAGWSADRITAFFSGIAQVLAAKSALEEGADD